MRKNLLVFIFLILFSQNTYAANDFDDVKKDRWSYEYISRLRDLGITQGYNNKFEPTKNLTRAEFITFLCNLMKWDTKNASTFSFDDNKDAKKWYYPYIETAVEHKVLLKESNNFLPNSNITREDMTIFITRALGYDELAKQMTYLSAPFSDVKRNIPYICIAKDFGIISGVNKNEFMPNNNATREQAATMLIRMYDALNNKIKSKNAFYAISSYSQVDFMDTFDSICFGWSRLETDGSKITLNTTTKNSNEYFIPQGAELPFEKAQAKNRLLMVALKDADSRAIMNDQALYLKASEVISGAINKGIGGLNFDGVLIDFEALKGQETKSNFNAFLVNLKKNIPNKKIYVAVHPKLPNTKDYYDAYDYRVISEIADKIIIMAHDYNAKVLTDSEMKNAQMVTPVSPIDKVYFALKSACDEISDKSKIVLQISFSAAQWQLSNDVIINEKVITPSYENIIKRLKSGTDILFNEKYKSAYLYFSEGGKENIIWFENNQSVYEKIRLAKLFGIDGISIWRLGIIPNDNEIEDLKIFNTIKNS